jgi:hypothetical protein
MQEETEEISTQGNHTCNNGTNFKLLTEKWQQSIVDYRDRGAADMTLRVDRQLKAVRDTIVSGRLCVINHKT